MNAVLEYFRVFVEGFDDAPSRDVHVPQVPFAQKTLKDFVGIGGDFRRASPQTKWMTVADFFVRCLDAVDRRRAAPTSKFLARLLGEKKKREFDLRGIELGGAP